MNKQLIRSIIAVVLLSLAVAGGTYAYFTLVVSGNNPVSTNSAKFDVIYTAGNGFEGNLQLVSTKEEGHQETVKIKVAPGSVNAKLYLYLNIDEMSPSLAISGFIWDIYGYRGGSQVYHNSGNFVGKSSSAGSNKIALVNNDYTVTSEETTFTLYLWLNGNLISTDLSGSSFRSHVSAESGTITGQIKTS